MNMFKLIGLTTMSAISSNQGFSQTLTFRKTTGFEVTLMEFKIEKTETGYRLEDDQKLDQTRATILWQKQDQKSNTSVKAKRIGDAIEINGTFQGAAVEKRYPTNGLAWYQAMGYNLITFVMSQKPKTTFVTIREDNLDLMEMEAKRESVGTVKVNGIETKAVKVKANLTGFMSMFWSASFWFSIDEEPMLMRYESVEGGPGTPLTIHEFVRQ